MPVGQKEERVAARSSSFAGTDRSRATVAALVDDLRRALYASKIISYAQGYVLLRQAENRLEPELRRHRACVARRLHHPKLFPKKKAGGGTVQEKGGGVF